MPLARIITDDPEAALELAIQLRSRGFQVETVAHGQIPATPADLEVELDLCNANSVLSRVMSFSGDADSYVFVAPGSLDQSVPQQPEIRSESVAQPSLAELSERSEEVVHLHTRIDPLKAVEKAGGPVEDLLEFHEPAIEVGSENHDEAIRELPDNSPVTLAEAIAVVPAAKSEIHPVSPDKPIGFEPAIAPVNLPFAVSYGPGDSPSSAVEPVEGVPSEPAKAEADAIGLGVPLAAKPAIGTANPPTAAPWRQSGIRLAVSRPGDTLFWRVAIPAAALATLVVVAGSLWQSRQPATGRLPTSAEQQIPFRKTPSPKVPGPSASRSPSSTAHGANSPESPAAATSPAPVPPQPAVNSAPQSLSPDSKPTQTPSVAVAHTRKAKPSAQHHTTARSHDSGLVARDTVVYFDKKPGSASPGTSNSSTK